MRRLFFLLSLLLACVAAGPVHAFVCSNPPGNEADEVYNRTYHVMEYCNGSQWMPEGVPGGGNFRPPMGAAAQMPTCNSGMEGGVWYNTDISNLEVCDGTTWQVVGSTSSGCGAVSGLSFTNLTNQSLYTVVYSNTATVTYSGCSSSQAVSVTGTATAQISVNGGPWATTGAISSGQTLQVRLTSSGSASTMLTATVTVGSSSTNWTVTTRSGSLQVFMTSGTYNGNLGGLSGADAICQSEAGTHGYAGTWKAILSDSTTSAASRLTLSYPIVRASDGALVAASNLWNGNLSNAIGGSGSVWTGSDSGGNSHSRAGATSYNFCGDWTTTTLGPTGEYGIGSSTNGTWLDSA
jgi:hypothetical protein